VFSHETALPRPQQKKARAFSHTWPKHRQTRVFRFQRTWAVQASPRRTKAAKERTGPPMGAQGHSTGSQSDPKDAQRKTKGIPEDPRGIRIPPKGGLQVTLDAQSREKACKNSRRLDKHTK